MYYDETTALLADLLKNSVTKEHTTPQQQGMSGYVPGPMIWMEILR
jgi:hypothetical protein